MSPLLNKLQTLLGSVHREYLVVDQNFSILEASSNVQQFTDCSDEVLKGKDVRNCFPELIGLEKILIAVIERQQVSFELKGIARTKHNPFYFNIYVTTNPDDNPQKRGLIIWLEDATAKMVLEQKIVQAANEKSLLLTTLAVAKNYVDKIIASISDTLLVTTASGQIKTVNQATVNLFGYGESELVDRPISIIITDKNLLPQASDRHIFQQYLNNVEVVCQTKTGKKAIVAFSRSALQTDGRELPDFIYVGRDISEHQRTQQRLAAQYAATRILSEAVTLGDAIPKILQAICESLAWELGELWTPDQYLGSNSRDGGDVVLRCVETWVQPSLAIPEFTAISWQTTFAPGVGLPGRVWASRSPHWITDLVNHPDIPRAEAAATAELHAAFGFPIQGDRELLGVMTFLSREVQPPDEDLLQMMVAIGSQVGQFVKRKQAETALLESEEQYRDLFENASDLIQCTTPDGHFIYVNHAWRETLGYSATEMAVLTVFDIIHPDDRASCRRVFHQVMSAKKLDRVKAAFISKDGRKISVEGSINCKFVSGRPVATRAIFRDITQRLEAEAALRYQQEQTERLLLNILPEPIANQLKQVEADSNPALGTCSTTPATIAESFADVTVLFADIVGFTRIAASLSPIELVDLLNHIFSAFDRLTEQRGLEKIKTIGDAYMVVGGLPTRRADRAEAIAEMALDMQREMARFNANDVGLHGCGPLRLRIGIHSGPVVAGVIGCKKFNYDLWGDTVNTASRMESHGLPGRIQVTAATYERLQEQYLFEERGAIEVKGKGLMTTYLLIGRKTQ